MKAKKLSLPMLKRLISEEFEKINEKFGEMKDIEDEAEKSEEVDAEDLADTIENKVDFAKKLKIKTESFIKEYNKTIKEIKILKAKLNKKN